MDSTAIYNIGGVLVEVRGAEAVRLLGEIEGFEQFLRPKDAEPVILYNSVPGQTFARNGEPFHSFRYGPLQCLLRRGDGRYSFEMTGRSGDPVYAFDYVEGSKTVRASVTEQAEVLRFGLWIAFGLTALDLGALMVHSSAVVRDNQAVLFLGESGTGKSTHSRLWLENIPGTLLLNDDSPVVCLGPDMVRAYGSPWSGKTSCYINENYRLAAIIRLHQAGANSIRRLEPVEAFAALYPSCPPAFAHDPFLSGQLAALVSGIVSKVPVFSLACLPEANAAHMVFNNVFLPDGCSE